MIYFLSMKITIKMVKFCPCSKRVGLIQVSTWLKHWEVSNCCWKSTNVINKVSLLQYIKIKKLAIHYFSSNPIFTFFLLVTVFINLTTVYICKQTWRTRSLSIDFRVHECRQVRRSWRRTYFQLSFLDQISRDSNMYRP